MSSFFQGTRCCQSSLCNNFDGRKFLLNEVDVRLLSPGATAMNKIRGFIPAEEDDSSNAANDTKMTIIMLTIILLVQIISNFMNDI
jgi:hypothetical protein